MATSFLSIFNRTDSRRWLSMNHRSDSTFKVSVCSIQGKREYMEDEYYISDDSLFVGVYDGHGGDSVSKYVKKSLYSYFYQSLPPRQTKSSWTNEEIIRAINSGFKSIERDIIPLNNWRHQGCTAALLYVNILNNLNEKSIITANIGDSRIVLSRNKKAIDLTVDHKPNSASERERIEALGGKVLWHGLVDSKGHPIPHTGVYRVNGNLALSRAIGIEYIFCLFHCTFFLFNLLLFRSKCCDGYFDTRLVLLNCDGE